MEKTLQKVVRDLLASYEAVGGLNNTDRLNLPSTRAIASICEDLLQLLFPGFHDEEPVHADFLSELTHVRITSMAERLEDQICRSMRTTEPECPQERARGVVAKFLESLPEIRELLRTDIEAAFEGDPAALSSEEIVLSYPFVSTMAIQRSAHLLYKAEVPLLPRMMTEWAHARTGIDIHPGAQIASHFFIDHGTGVVIGETSVIGQRVKLYQGVALIGRSLAGGQSLKGKRRHPTIEADVTIYAGTTIMGADTVIGAGSTIGANVFLTHSVPSRSLVFYEEKQLRILDKRNRDAETALEWVI
ncbi:MAG: serine O-acetyltransferase [Chthoniobacterales bacterium]